jgi:hypothetical protein
MKYVVYVTPVGRSEMPAKFLSVNLISVGVDRTLVRKLSSYKQVVG